MSSTGTPIPSLRRTASAALLVATTLLLAGGAAAQNLASPIGLWKTVDDETKQPKSLVRIVEKDGELVGRVEKILTDRTDARCDRCTDERKDQPVQGMTIVTGMKPDGDLWDGGSILDPNNGKVYRSRMKLLEGGRKLEVRGYIGAPLFGRSQVWLREE